jgi:hypothetical protein
MRLADLCRRFPPDSPDPMSSSLDDSSADTEQTEQTSLHRLGNNTTSLRKLSTHACLSLCCNYLVMVKGN